MLYNCIKHASVMALILLLATTIGFAAPQKTPNQIEPRILIPGAPKNRPAPTFIINRPGSYYLGGNRHAIGTGISVKANNVTIDLMGYSLVGTSSPGKGIEMIDRKNVRIMNGTIRRFASYGVSNIIIGENHQLINLRIHSNLRGISLLGDSHLVKNCVVSNNLGWGISVEYQSMVIGNIVSRNQGIGIIGDDGSSIIENKVYNNGSGISVDYGCTIERNTVISNNGEGIHGWIGSVISENTVNYNDEEGITVHENSLLKGNMSYENDGDNFYASGDDNVFIGNQGIDSVGGCGFKIEQDGNYFQNNRASGNSAGEFCDPPSGVSDGGGNIGF